MILRRLWHAPAQTLRDLIAFCGVRAAILLPLHGLSFVFSALQVVQLFKAPEWVPWAVCLVNAAGALYSLYFIHRQKLQTPSRW